MLKLSAQLTQERAVTVHHIETGELHKALQLDASFIEEDIDNRQELAKY